MTSEEFKISVPVELWTIEVSVDSTHHSVESELLILSLLSHFDGIGGLAGSLKESGHLWGAYSNLLRRGLLKIEGQDVVVDSEIASNEFSDEMIALLQEGHSSNTFEVEVVRDLYFGDFHQTAILKTSRSSETLPTIEELPIRQQSFEEMNMGSLDISEVLGPVGKTVSWNSKSPFHKAIEGAQIINIEAEELTTEINFRRHHKSDGSIISIPKHSSIFSNKLIQSLEILSPSFERKEIVRTWPISPELKLLAQIEEIQSIIRGSSDDESNGIAKAMIRDFATNLENALPLFDDSAVSRLNAVEIVVGTEAEQWNAVCQVLDSAKENALILSAFSNLRFAKDTAQRIEENLSPETHLQLLVGEPDRINEVNFESRVKNYSESLEISNEYRVSVNTTKVPSHAKFAISDTGRVWIGSCNLLSAAPGSWVVETGLLIDDVKFAESILQHIEDWVKPESIKTFQQLSEGIGALKHSQRHCLKPAFRKQLENSVEKFKELMAEQDNLQAGKFENTQELEKANINLQKKVDRLIETAISNLRKIAEKPCYQLIPTEVHRSLMLEMIDQSKNRICLASDNLRNTGLDKAVFNRLNQQPLNDSQRKFRFSTSIYWGRDDPHNVDEDQDIIEANSIIDNLKAAYESMNIKEPEFWFCSSCHSTLNKNIAQCDCGSRKPKKVYTNFYPHEYTGPMMSHAKFVMSDDRRMLLTSHNILGGKNDDIIATDATELGILIDSPRLIQHMRGEVDLLMPEGVAGKFDFNPWYAALATAVQDLGGEAEFNEVMDTFFGRIESNDEFKNSFSNILYWMAERLRKPISDDEIPFYLLKKAKNEKLLKFNESHLNNIKESGIEVDESSEGNECIIRLPNSSETWLDVEQIECLISTVKQLQDETGWAKTVSVAEILSQPSSIFSLIPGKKRYHERLLEFLETLFPIFEIKSQGSITSIRVKGD